MATGGFFGQYAHALDEKGRVSVPAQFRILMEADAEATGERGLYVTAGLDGCLFAYTPARWLDLQRVVTEGGRHAIASAAKRRFQRLFFAQAKFCEPDGQGRILLPDHLRATAKLGKQVVFVGVLDRMEIWDADAWAREQAAGAADYESAAAKALEWEADA
jgi:MraZ protein